MSDLTKTALFDLPTDADAPMDPSADSACTAVAAGDAPSGTQGDGWEHAGASSLVTPAFDPSALAAPAAPQAPAAPAPAAVPSSGALDVRREWVARLLDLSLRSNLVNMKEGSRAKVWEGLTAIEAARKLLANDMGDIEDGSDHALESMRRTADEASKESGVDVLFAVFGLVTWRRADEGAGDAHRMPLLMAPAELDFDRMTKRFFVRAHFGDLRMNPALAELAHDELGLVVPDFADVLAGRMADAATNVVLCEMRALLEDAEGWDVEDAAALGVFPFARMALYRDLSAHVRSPFTSKVAAALANETLALAGAGISSNVAEPAGRLSPVGHVLPLATDASQLRAVQLAAQGESFVMDGPPGTGKSQTIVNIAVDAMVHGKTVLVASEKAAALEVVRKRLTDVGLGDFCLPLFGKERTGRLLDQLARVIEAAESDEQPAAPAYDMRELVSLARSLDAYADLLARPTRAGIDVREAMARYLAVRDADDVVRVNEPALSCIESDEDIEAAKRLIERMGAASDALGFARGYPFETLSAQEIERLSRGGLRAAAAAYANAASDAACMCAGLAHIAGVERPRTGEEILACQQAARALVAWQGEEAWLANASPEELEGVLSRVSSRTAARRVAEGVLMATAQGVPAFDAVRACVAADERLNDARADLGMFEQALPEPDDGDWLEAQQQAAADLVEAADDVATWRSWHALRAEADERGLLSAAGAFRCGFTTKEVIASFEKALYGAICTEELAADATAESFSGAVLEQTIEQYRAADAAYRARLKEALPAVLVARARAACSDPLLLEQLVGLKRVLRSRSRTVSLRFVMQHFRNIVVGLCPCVLATPVAVAQRFAWDAVFDLAIFDEASQLDTAHAIGVLERSRQVIVAGDPQQLPPTSFFERQRFAESEGIIDLDSLLLIGGESLLDDCLAVGLARVNLRWHYRSRHESLISFSNRRFYDSRLRTFPSPDDRVSRVKLVPVAGIYEGGGVNRAEAAALVAEVKARYAAAPDEPASLGIITFNVRQQGVIEQLLDEVFAENEALRDWACGGAEPLFVKNLENVQGDERDLIMLSVTYGPDERGRVAQRFGPINMRGGERRLNVAFTRARGEMLVFSTMRASQIDASFAASEGVRVLRDFLAYAEAGARSAGGMTERAAGHAAEEDAEFAGEEALAMEDAGVNEPVTVLDLAIAAGVVRDAAAGDAAAVDVAGNAPAAEAPAAEVEPALAPPAAGALGATAESEDLPAPSAETTPVPSFGFDSAPAPEAPADPDPAPAPEVPAPEHTDALAAALAAALEQAGWQVVPNVGASALKVDLAVVDPDDSDRYCAGILLDGASYRAARTTRDRDVLRDEMLEALGWKLTHVWTLDCYNNFDREVKRVTAFLKDATS